MSRPDPSGGYDRLARCYRTLERLLFGGSLMRSRLAHLPALDGARRVLIAGEGDGHFVAGRSGSRSDLRRRVAPSTGRRAERMIHEK